MEFIRVNDNMVKCLISEEDMDEYDVSIEDFFTRSENALELLHEIVKQASEEVGYKPQGPLTALQIAPIDEHGIAIFLTEKPQTDLQTFINNIKKNTALDVTDDMIEKLEHASDEEKADFVGKLMKNIHAEIEKNLMQSKAELQKHLENKKQNESLGESADKRSFKEVLDSAMRVGADGSRHFVSLDRKIFMFDSISELLRYAKVVEPPKEIKSSLYKSKKEEKYFLVIDRNDVEVGTLAGVYLTAYEYAHFVSEKEDHERVIKKNCECLIEDCAIERLKG